MSKIIGNTTATPNPQPDWGQTNEAKADYIKNKPELGELATKDEVAKTDLSSEVQGLLDKADTAMQSYEETDPTVPEWAKEANKPSYDLGEISDTQDYVRMTPTERIKLSNIDEYANKYSHPDTHDAGMITGLADVATSGSYGDLVGVPSEFTPSYHTHDYIPTSQRGVANGVAALDANGKVPSAQLPSYVDDVLEFGEESSFPTEGETGKIYVDTTTNKTYRWGGTAYAEISASLALGETPSTAYAGDKGKIAYVHSQVTSGNPHGVTKYDVELGNVPNVTTNDQAPTFTEGSTLENIASGEKVTTLFSKIKRAITDLIAHIANKDNPHEVSLDQLTDTEDYVKMTLTERDKLSKIEDDAEVNVQADWKQEDTTADSYINNKPALGSLAAKSEVSKSDLASDIKAEIEGKAESSTLENTSKTVSDNTDRIKELEDGKVDKVDGKGLSTNDFTDDYKHAVDPFVKTPSVGLWYSDDGDGGYSVRGIGTCKDVDIIIPSIVDGIYVSCIARNAFKGNTSIRSVEILNGVSSIDPYAFSDCSAMTNIVIPDSVTAIGSNAFTGCSSLTSITIPDNVTTIGASAFDGCTALTSITIPNRVKSIGEAAFTACDSLISVVIPKSVVDIGNYAFDTGGDLTIYCEAASPPDGWKQDWNYSNKPVIWGAVFDFCGVNKRLEEITAQIKEIRLLLGGS